jgi:hypothetical protein
MTSTDPTTAHYRAAIRALRNDESARNLWDHMSDEDYSDALASIADAVEYQGSPERARDYGADHEWADSSCIYTYDIRQWADANPDALDYWAAYAASEYGGDILTTDAQGQPVGDVLDRIRTIARYTCLTSTWNAAAQDVESMAQDIADTDPFAGWVAS